MDAPLDFAFDVRINRLMGGWRAVVEDARRLHKTVMRLPDHCDCTAAAECDCCRSLERPFPEQCFVCAEHVATVSMQLAAVLDDTLRYVPALDVILSAQSDAIHAPLRGVAAATIRLLRLLDELRSATGEFQHGCRGVHIQRLKRATDGLKDAVERAHACLHAI